MRRLAVLRPETRPQALDRYKLADSVIAYSSRVAQAAADTLDPGRRARLSTTPRSPAASSALQVARQNAAAKVTDPARRAAPARSRTRTATVRRIMRARRGGRGRRRRRATSPARSPLPAARSTRTARSPPPNNIAAAAIAAARSRLGVPYVWGATGPNSFDCSGLTQWSYAHAGITLPRIAAEQWNSGPHPSLSDLEPGDLLFWALNTSDPSTIHHVAMYIGRGMMIAAPHTGENVQIQPVYMTGFIGATRPWASLARRDRTRPVPPYDRGACSRSPRPAHGSTIVTASTTRCGLAPACTLWRATDEVLGRPVAVRVVTGQTKAQFKELTAAVGRAGQVLGRPLGPGPRRRQRAGRPTADRRGSSANGSTRPSLARHAAPATRCAGRSRPPSCCPAPRPSPPRTASGAQHGALHPGEVLLPADGQPPADRPRARRRASRRRRPAAGRRRQPPTYDDTRGLGGLLYACLTGRWPLPGWTGLPAPTRGDGAAPAPAARRGQPRARRDHRPRAVRRLLRAGRAPPRPRGASEAPLHPGHRQPVDHESDRRWTTRRLAGRAAAAGRRRRLWCRGRSAATSAGCRARPGRSRPAVPQPAPARRRRRRQVVWSKPPHDHRASTRRATAPRTRAGSGSRSTTTRRRRGPPTPTTATRSSAGSSAASACCSTSGAQDACRQRRPAAVGAGRRTCSSAPGNAPPHQADRPAGRRRARRQPRPRPTSPRHTRSRARYWLVWFTSLPKAGSDYRLGVAEIALQH